MEKKKSAIFFQSDLFKITYSVIFLLLLILGVYTVIKPEPFLKFGYMGVFMFNALGGLGTYLIPTLAQNMNLGLLAFSFSLGMTVNDSLSWVIGQGGTAIIPRGKWSKKIKQSVGKYEFWTLLILSLLPLPYDVIGLMSGYLGLKYLNFFIPTFLGKFLRVILIGLGTRELISLF